MIEKEIRIKVQIGSRFQEKFFYNSVLGCMKPILMCFCSNHKKNKVEITVIDE